MLASESTPVGTFVLQMGVLVCLCAYYGITHGRKALLYCLFAGCWKGDWDSCRHRQPLENPLLCCHQCQWLWLAEIMVQVLLGECCCHVSLCPCSPPTSLRVCGALIASTQVCAGGWWWVSGLPGVLGLSYWLLAWPIQLLVVSSAVINMKYTSYIKRKIASLT